jgi:RNA polymerase sigma factor (sigma-70 family)
MDHLPPTRTSADSVGSKWPRFGGPERSTRTDAEPAATPTPAAWVVGRPLGDLLVAMQSEDDALRDAAWAECYRQYYQVVWTRAFYVMRSIAWLPEPREAAADVASDVFVGLPHAAARYREEGRADWWLKQVVVRTALRRKEALTGRWTSSRRDAQEPVGRSYAAFDESADEIVAFLDSVEREELMELERRREALRKSPDPGKRRWDEFLDLYVAGCGFQEIGDRMGLTEGTARNWLCQIRKHLARPLGRE